MKSPLLLAAGAALLAYVLLLVGITYVEQDRRVAADAEQIRLDLEKRAAALAYFYSVRRNDMQDLQDHRSLVAFFANRDLGMSMQYGLGASLLKMGQAFEAMRLQRYIAEKPVYLRLAFREIDGRILLDTETGTPLNPPRELDLRGATALEFRILILDEAGRKRSLISSPVFYKQRLMGHILAWIDHDMVLGQLITQSAQGKGMKLVTYTDAPPGEYLALAPAPGEHGVRHLEGGGMSARVRVEDTPFQLLGVFPESGHSGFFSSRWLTLSLLLLAGLILAGVWSAVRIRTDNLVLKAHVEESARQEAILQHNNEALKTEMAKRQAYEKELVDARRQAETASRAKSDFLATMSHEIRTPLNGVLGMAQLLDDTPLDPEQKESVEVINESGKALFNVINDILDFSKIEAGRMELESIPFDLERSAHEVARLFNVRCQRKDIEMALDFSPDCPRHLLGDAGRIRQILLNLVGNAVKFTEHGHILIQIRSEGQNGEYARLYFSVSDTGIGIDPDIQKNLFQSFTQADSSTTRRHGGTGLGLAINKQLVELMGGEIGVNSQPGAGAEFWFRLNLPLSAPPDPLPQTELHGIHTLLVDDTDINLQVLGRTLDSFGMAVDTARDTAEVMAHLQASMDTDRPYRIAILDNQLHGSNGEQLARLIHASRDYGSLPLVLLTSNAERGDAARFSQAGFVAYLTKPVLTDTLRNTLASALAGADRDAASRPLITRHSIDESSNQERQGPMRFTGRVLLAEDVKPNRIVAASMLKRFGLEVESAEDGREALEKWRGGGFDLILMDCQMPVLDGYEATRTIRRQENDEHTPIIALTANVFADNQQRCRAAGMDDFVPKPFETQRLAEALKKWLAAPPRTQAWTKVIRHSPDPLIDTMALDKLSDMLQEDFVEFIEAYMESSGEILEGLLQAHAQGDTGQFERLAHSLKSASLNVHAKALAEMAEKLEIETHATGLPGDTRALTGLNREFRQVRSTLQEYMRARQARGPH